MEDAFMTRFTILAALTVGGATYIIFTLAGSALASIPV